MKFSLMPLLIVIIGLASTSAWAQTDEIIVTASRINSGNSIPGQVLMVRGDNLLLEVRIESDARERAERLKELRQTIESFTQAANRDSKISLSFVDSSNSVRPLSPSLYDDAIGRGSRPDTSVATIQIKTAIPETVEDSFSLATQLVRFVDTIEEKGRISIEQTDEVAISVVNPEQYRSAVINQVTSEINDISAQLGGNYRVVLENIDRPIRRYRAGDLTLGFYIPYQYTVIPTSLNALTTPLDDD